MERRCEVSQFIDDARAATSSPGVKRFLDMMEDYEATHTDEESGRMWVWVRDYFKADLEVRND